MYLRDNGIHDVASWFDKAPPKRGKMHWQPGRSALELAQYMTKRYPMLPAELTCFLGHFTGADTTFRWAAEHVTSLAAHGLGVGEGRNHDVFLWSDGLVVGIEGKADEPLGGKYVREAYDTGSENKRRRIDGMLQMLFGDGVTGDDCPTLRYQLLTASTATLLEAKDSQAETAVLLVIVCKRPGYFQVEKIRQNDRDIAAFLQVVPKVGGAGYWQIETDYGRKNGIRFYFGKIEIDLPAIV